MRWLIVIAVALPGCLYFESEDREPHGCPAIACTDLFAMITVKIVNSSNAPVSGLATQSIYVDTGQPIMTYNSGIDDGTYVIVDDSFLGQALADRDHHTIRFEASRPATGQSVTADYVIAADECACHISPVAGPDLLVIP